MADDSPPPPTGDATPASPTSTPGSAGTPTAAVSKDSGNRTLFVILAALAIAAIAGVGGYFLGRNSTTATPAASPSLTAHATASASASLLSTPTPTATATVTAAPTVAPTAVAPSCPPAGLPRPLPAMDPGDNGTPTGVDETGCGNGTVPASNTPFTIGSGWVVATAESCNGDAGPGGMGTAIEFTAHNTATGADLPPIQDPTWGSGASGADGSGSGTPAPAGTYVIHVTIVHPDVNQCQWHVAIYTGNAH